MIPAINLIRDPLPVATIAAILEDTAGHSALPRLGAPEWKAAGENPAIQAWLVPLKERALAAGGEPMPELTDELYSHFARTGIRLPFEKLYFKRRNLLSQTAIAILLGDDSYRARLEASFVTKLTAIMEETSWALPASIREQPTGKDPDMIDLFAAETANTLAELLVVFRDLIPAALARRIRDRLHAGTFENYANRNPPFPWTGWAMNWNAVCHQGIVGSALAVETDHTLVAKILSRAAAALQEFLSGFGEDGSTSEGPGYWSYGFGWFTEMNAQLEHRTAGRLSLFEGDEKIRRIAHFAPAFTFSNGHFVNFSDGHQKGRLNPALLDYLGRRLDSPILTAHARWIYRHQAEVGIDLEATRSDFFYCSRLALRAPSPEELARASEPRPTDGYFENYGAIVARGTDRAGHFWELAAKAGHNEEHHNHNDCGSFILNIDGRPVLMEIGAPEYTKDFFTLPQRYDYLAARSLGHSVPFVNGCEQSAGRDYKASVIKASLSDDYVEFVVDLTGCYPIEARCRRLVRTWLWDKPAGKLTISDTCELAEPGTMESILLSHDDVTRENGALLIQGKTPVRIQPGPDSTVLIENCPYRGHRGTDETVNRIRITPSSPPSTTRTVTCEITIG